MERKYTISTMTSQMKKILEDIKVMAENMTTDHKIKRSLGYVALAVSFVAGVLAILPVVVWFGAGRLANELMEEKR